MSNDCLEVDLVVTGQVSDYDTKSKQSSFLKKFATFANVLVSQVYIKSLSAGSVHIIIGVLPTAVSEVSTKLTSANSTELLSTALGTPVLSVQQTELSPPPPPPVAAEGGGGGAGAAIGIALGAIFGLGFIAFLVWFYKSRTSERRVSLVKMDGSNPSVGSRLSLTYAKDDSLLKKEGCSQLSSSSQKYTAQV